ncbi:MFS transporter [Massilia sp. LXY-6]|uniref:MFS transporter n=1 Tax=Massilia sp. LXY-6 TaxID=3379823 RepID=UPI003EE12575
MHIAPPRRPRLLLLTIFLLTATEYLQTGMIAFGAGPIMGGIGAAPEEFSLISVIYACVAVAVISKQRWLAERLGWRRFMLCSLAVFICGAALCAASESTWQFTAGRIVMALGGGSFMTSSRVLVNLFPPSPARFTGIRFFATALAVGSSGGPLLASVAVSNQGWQWIFMILIGLAVAIAALAVACLPGEVPPHALRTQSHPVLLMALVAGTFALLYAFQRSYYDFYSDLPMLLAGAALGALALGYFVHAMHRGERPLLHLRELRNARYASGLALFTFCYTLMGATNYMLPAVLQRGLGFAWEAIGPVQAAGLAATVLTWVLMQLVLPKRPAAKKYYLAGFLALAVFGWRIAGLNPHADLWRDVVPALACYGVFVMLVLATTAMHTFREVQHHETVFSHAQQVKNMLAQFGSGLGVAAATAVLQGRIAAHHAVLNGRFAAGDPAYDEALHTLGQSLAQQGAAEPAALAAASLAQGLAQQATLLAALDYFQVVGFIGLAGAAVMLAQRVLK